MYEEDIAELLAPYPPRRRAPVVRSRKDVLTAQLRSIADELAQLDNRPAEPAGAYPTVGFTIRFEAEGVGYTYTARKAGGWWYATGSTQAGRARTWDELLDWIDNSHVDGLQASGLQEYTGARLLLSP